MNRQNALKLRTLFSGAWITQAIYIAAKLQIADILRDGPKSIDNLASHTRTRPELLFRVLRALASYDVFTESESRVFKNTGLSELLISDAENSLRNVALLYGDQTYQAFEYFEDQLRTGEIAYNKKFGTDFFSFIKTDQARSDSFNLAMSEISYEQGGAILDTFDFSGINTLCDLAGGNGKLLSFVLASYPQMKGILFEQPHVLAEAKSYFTGQEQMDRVSFLSGDFFQPFEFEANVGLLKYIIHDWTDDKATLILKHCKKAFKKILIIEQMIPPGNERLYGKIADLMMMTSFGSRERSQEEFESLFQSAGLKLKQIHSTDYLLSVFELDSQT